VQITAVKNYESLDYIRIVSPTPWTDSFPFWELGVFYVKCEMRTKLLYIIRINFLLLGVKIGSCQRRDYRKLKNTNCYVMLRKEHRPLVHCWEKNTDLLCTVERRTPTSCALLKEEHRLLLHCNDTSGSIKRRILQFQYRIVHILVTYFILSSKSRNSVISEVQDIYRLIKYLPAFPAFRIFSLQTLPSPQPPHSDYWLAITEMTLNHKDC